MENYLSFETFKDRINKELYIDRSKLDLMAAENPLLIQKYLNLWFEKSADLNKMELKLDQLMKEKLIHYKTDFKLVPETVKELSMLIKGDDEVSKLNEIIIVLSTRVSYLHQVVQNFKERSWAIKNVIEFRKFIEGE